MEIRELLYEELGEASKVLWKSFYEAEKKNCSMSGMELFRDLTSPVSLAMNTCDGKNVLYGLFLQKELIAVGLLREKKKILMLYVHPSGWHQGYGTRLLAFMEQNCDTNAIELNASDFAVPFYEKKGYVKIAPRRNEDELYVTPMKKNK